MKKVSDYLKNDYSLLRLYRDDLDNINEVISQFSPKSTWTTDKYTYDSFDEFINGNKQKELKKLEIQIYTPYVNIRLSKNLSELSVHSDEIAHEGLYNRLDRILSSKEFKLAFLFNAKVYWIVLITYWIILFSTNVNIPTPISATFFGLLIFVQGLGGYWKLTRNTIIKMTLKDDEKGFVARNKDQIILLLLGGILGSALTLLVDYLKDR